MALRYAKLPRKIPIRLDKQLRESTGVYYRALDHIMAHRVCAEHGAQRLTPLLGVTTPLILQTTHRRDTQRSDPGCCKSHRSESQS
jgi:hypothetical protein